MFKTIQKIHFVGIGGSGMSGIAEVLVNLGYKVTGSDLKQSDVTDRLQGLGAEIFYGHRKQNVGETQVVVTSTAVRKDNPEVKQALKLKIPVIPRIEMLAELARLKYTIAVAGTHGKTTTTSMVAAIFQEAGWDPTFIIGGLVKHLGSGAKLGSGEFLVAEADESDGSFLKLSPAVGIITNIDDDHLDYYQTTQRLKDAFIQFANRVPFYGMAIVCADDLELNVPFEKIARALGNFESVGRRFEKRGEKNGAVWIDDYGHHPTEIRAVMQALRERYPDKTIVAAVQPHRYSRT